MISYFIQYPASYHLSGFHVLSFSYLTPVNLQELHIFLYFREQFSLQVVQPMKFSSIGGGTVMNR